MMTKALQEGVSTLSQDLMNTVKHIYHFYIGFLAVSGVNYMVFFAQSIRADTPEIRFFLLLSYGVAYAWFIGSAYDLIEGLVKIPYKLIRKQYASYRVEVSS